MVSERLCKNNIKGGVRKSPIKSALLTDTPKFTMFSRHFHNAIGIPDAF